MHKITNQNQGQCLQIWRSNFWTIQAFGTLRGGHSGQRFVASGHVFICFGSTGRLLNIHRPCLRCQYTAICIGGFTNNNNNNIGEGLPIIIVNYCIGSSILEPNILLNIPAFQVRRANGAFHVRHYFTGSCDQLGCAHILSIVNLALPQALFGATFEKSS